MNSTYTWTDQTRGIDVMNKGACKTELDLFVRLFGLYEPLTEMNLRFIHDEKPEWFTWLVDQGFVKEYDEFVFEPCESKNAMYIKCGDFTIAKVSITREEGIEIFRFSSIATTGVALDANECVKVRTRDW